jgi:hypothetical protein
VVGDQERCVVCLVAAVGQLVLVEGLRGEESVGTEVVPAGGDALVVTFGECRDPVEVRAVGLTVVRVTADGVTELEVTPQDAVEVPLVDRHVPRLAVVDPGRPGSREAVGLRLVLDAPAAGRKADTRLDGMAELVGEHDRRQ